MQTEKTLISSAVVNCTWQNIERLDHPGIILEDRLLRIKASLRVKLPSNLTQLNTYTFSVGPFCSFTNLGDGTAILTEETTTNIGHYLAGTPLSSDIQLLLQSHHSIGNSLGKIISNQILKKCCRYIPALADSSILKLHIGHVKILTKGKPYSIYSKESPIHTRLESGIEEKGLNYLSIAGMKMTYTYQNARMAAQLLTDHFHVRDALLHLLPYLPIATAREPHRMSFRDKLLIRSYLSVKTNLSLKKIGQIISDTQLHTLLQRYRSIEQSHAILNKLLVADISHLHVI